jgi:DNA invertase Pin-like site-specific DNA recombinase
MMFKSARRGEAHHSNRLKATEVLDIRKRIIEGEMLKTLAAEYDIGTTTVWNIKHRNTWAWLMEEKPDDLAKHHR